MNATASTSPDFRVLKRAQIVRSKTNPRTHFDAAYITEMGKSLAAHGFLQPILVRPLPAARLQDTLAQGSKKHQVPRRRLPSNFDIDALQIEAGVPIPAQGNAKASVDWHRLFKRMKAGESVVLPRSAHGSLSKAKTDSKKTGGPELSIRLIDAEKLRLWRIK